ncbi:MAG: glycosyltransferase family A protein [Anaerolineales bacterium]
MTSNVAHSSGSSLRATLFTAPKPFVGPIDVIQRNALRSWRELGEGVEVLVIGDEPGAAQAARAVGVRHVPAVRRSAEGTPLLSSIFEAAHREASFPILAYLNADIVLLDDFLPAVDQVARRMGTFLIVGQRWNLDVAEPIPFAPGWRQVIRGRLEAEGRLHPPTGSDYFVFPKGEFSRLPDFALGRSGWDNWMVFDARRRGIPVVDATGVVRVVHQNHDYAHLPGSRPHHGQVESRRNVALAGGREAMFRLRDADWKLCPRGPVRKSWSERGFLRMLEADTIARIGPGRSAQITRMVFHPVHTLGYFVRRGLHTLQRPGRHEAGTVRPPEEGES